MKRISWFITVIVILLCFFMLFTFLVNINTRVKLLEEKINSECSPWDPRCKENVQDFEGCKHE